MELLSVVIITYNEELNIAKCLQSVQGLADEIVILDSFSSDSTVEIARQFGAKVYQQKFAGYVQQKNSALALATHNRVLSLDADEELSSGLFASIAAEKKNFQMKAYKMNRRAFYCGRFILHGSWYPEPKVRLFDRRAVTWGGLDPHDRVVLPAGIPIGHLKGDILHYICDSVEEHRLRSVNFSNIAARSLFDAGKKTNWFKILASPAWFFLVDYIFKAGFLDGWRGWKIASIQTRYHFEKYRKLRKLWKIAK
ncbi:MAG: glycosyltransferase family 2 protein [Chitinophagaceae bacterium]|nr:MAG: glycosyltransferase family 2 protein [Chitinophagaceae bacterium]